MSRYLGRPSAGEVASVRQYQYDRGGSVSAPEDRPECERADCQRIAATASEVYCAITGGLLSYPTYDARTILAHYEDDVQKLVDAETAEVRTEKANIRAVLNEHYVRAGQEIADLRNSLEACRNAGESIRDELAEARELFSAIHEVDLARESAALARIAAVEALSDQFLARRDAIDANDQRGTPGRRARLAWEDAARAVRAALSVDLPGSS